MTRVHYCFNQHLNESLPPRRCPGKCNKKRCNCKKCKCRGNITIERARSLVESGFAQWVILTTIPMQTKMVCPICSNDVLLKKSCQNCNSTGEIISVESIPMYGNEIVMVVMGSGEPGREEFSSVSAKQTPRVATIEISHIQRAYINGYQEEIERINIYGQMNAEFLNSLIAPFKPDPNDGRCLFPFGPDERSFNY